MTYRARQPIHLALGLALTGSVILVGAVYAATRDGYPKYHALLDAIERRDVKAVRSQLANGTNPNAFPPPNWREDDMSPMDAAVSSGDIEVVGVLLEHGADIEAWDSWGGLPLNVAARNGDIAMMKFLLAKGAKVNDLGADGSTALYGAAVSGQVPALRLLLSRGANP